MNCKREKDQTRGGGARLPEHLPIFFFISTTICSLMWLKNLSLFAFVSISSCVWLQDLSNLISPGTVPRPPITFRLVVPASQVLQQRHYTLATILCTLHTVHRTVSTDHCTHKLYTVHCGVITEDCTLFTAYCELILYTELSMVLTI